MVYKVTRDLIKAQKSQLIRDLDVLVTDENRTERDSEITDDVGQLKGRTTAVGIGVAAVYVTVMLLMRMLVEIGQGHGTGGRTGGKVTTARRKVSTST